MTIKDMKAQGLLLFECISGSRSYGLETSASDTDLKGVYYLPRSVFYGLNYIPQISNESNDEVYYELGRYVELLIKNNPNCLEMLATPDDCVLYKHPIMDQLYPELFLSKLCKDTFAGYAITQIGKAKGLKKKITNPYNREKLSVLDFCFVIRSYHSTAVEQWLNEGGRRQEQCGLVNIPHSKGLFGLFYDPKNELQYKGIITGIHANDVSISSVPKGEQEVAYLFFNADGYSSYCKQHKEYWQWVEKRNETRYLNAMAHGKDYDSKNMMHTIRLLQVAEDILKTGKLTVRRSNRDELLNIKSGSFEYDDLLKKAENLIEEIDAAFAESSLPDLVDVNKLEEVLICMRTALYSTNK